MDRYHKRSNVESTNSMIKSKFTDIIRSKNEIAYINEALLKILCHNIVVLIQSMYELRIEPEFLNGLRAFMKDRIFAKIDFFCLIVEYAISVNIMPDKITKQKSDISKV